MSSTNPSAPNHPAAGSFPSVVSPTVVGRTHRHRPSETAAAPPLNNIHLNVAAAADTAARGNDAAAAGSAVERYNGAAVANADAARVLNVGAAAADAHAVGVAGDTADNISNINTCPICQEPPNEAITLGIQSNQAMCLACLAT